MYSWATSEMHENTGFPTVLIQQPITEFTPEFPVLFFLQHSFPLVEEGKEDSLVEPAL